ncbi:MAG: hypothetical protein DMG49_19340 [Acidobacteria bacterium]|nr:MAG: hypothetical protein DMG49_19340 [Acidobacteriota bacterium]
MNTVTEAGLLTAWERAQKNDPRAFKFKRVKDRQHHFATKRFPFDGDLLVRNAVVEDFSAVNQDGTSMGTVEVELQGATDDFYRTCARSYAQWNTPNTLYWDPKARQLADPGAVLSVRRAPAFPPRRSGRR